MEPGYLSESPEAQFTNADAIIYLLKQYFLTGNEDAEYRNAFYRVQMDKGESFATFKARFLSAAVQGKVKQDEWFFYLWEKILPGLRIANLGFKALWNGDFYTMVNHLAAYDIERRYIPERPPIQDRPRMVAQTTVKRTTGVNH